MTATVHAIPGGGAGYYFSGIAANYYNPSESRWGGQALTALGIMPGPVDRAVMERLLDGYLPDGSRLGNPSKDGWSRDQGRDLTFNVPKSLSVLAQGPMRKPILDVMERAANTSMAFVERDIARVRVSIGKGDRQLYQPAGLVWAAFREHSNRNGDPHLHQHTPIINAALMPDGTFRSLHMDRFYHGRSLIDKVYMSELAAGMRELGFNIKTFGRDGKFEIDGIPEAVLKAFSTRTQEIHDKVEGDVSPARRASAAIITRGHKQNTNPEVLKEDWDKRLKELGADFKALTDQALARGQQIGVKPQDKGVTAKDMVTRSVEALSETNREYSRQELLTAVFKRAQSGFSLKQIDAGIDDLLKEGILVQENIRDDAYFAKASQIEKEGKLIDAWQKMSLAGKPMTSQESVAQVLDPSILSKGQKNMASAMALYHDRGVLVQGSAGTGKTTALKTVIPLIKDGGYTVIGLGPSNAAEDELQKTGVFDKVMTVQRWMMKPIGNQKSILVVDEASMLDTDQALKLLNYANENKLARIVLMGDRNQMESPGAGTPFKDLQDAGFKTVTLNEIIRQKDLRQRQGVQALAIENIRKGIALLKPNFREVPKDTLEVKAVELWQAAKDTGTPVIVQTNHQKDVINKLIKSTLPQAIEPGSPQNVLKPLHLADVDKYFVESYRGATHIHFDRPLKRLDIKAGDIWRIKDTSEDQAEMTLSRGDKTIAFRPARYTGIGSSIKAYKAQTIDLNAGDRIRFTRGHRDIGINNNDFAYIKSIDDQRMVVELDKGRTQILPRDHKAARYMDHAWVNTAHAFQGKTVNKAVLVMPSVAKPLTTLNSLYTGASRHRLSLDIVTDNIDRLQNTIETALKTRQERDRLFRRADTPEMSKELSRADMARGLAIEVQDGYSAKHNAKVKGKKQDMDIARKNDHSQSKDQSLDMAKSSRDQSKSLGRGKSIERAPATPNPMPDSGPKRDRGRGMDF